MFRRRERDPNPENQQMGRIRRTGQWWMTSKSAQSVSIVFVLLLFGTALYLVIFPAPTTSGTAAPIATSVQPSVATPAPTTVAAQCKPQEAVEYSPERVVLGEYETIWSPVGTVLAPISVTGGPWNGASCFARTPEGALYAVANRQAHEADAAGVGGWKFIGYRWNQFTPDLATVTVAIGAVDGTGGAAARVFTAKWQDDDWAVQPPQSSTAETIDSLRTFTPWGGS